MSDLGQYICPCGATLLSRQDCLESGDEILRHVGEAYLSGEDGYCIEEDDVVPFAWASRTRAEHEHQRRLAMQRPIGRDVPFTPMPEDF